MRWINRYNRWLEQHWVAPTYSGWVILLLTASFWLAAANTLAGWLYVLSGTCLALLFVAAWLPTRLLKGITVQRAPLYSICVGETLSLGITLASTSASKAILLQCQDQLPATFEAPLWQTLEWSDEPKYHWTFGVTPQQRGLYQWQIITLKTGMPFGLFSCQRRRICPASVLIYPEILALSHCPILDEFAAVQSHHLDQQHSQQLGQDGTTRSLRPYRHGDARRLIHWRSSAKFNELRTRELEVIAGESPVIIALNSGDRWSTDNFESAVIAASSLFRYAQQHGIAVQVWTAGAGIQRQDIDVLETLALVDLRETETYPIPNLPVLWLTEDLQSAASLAPGSRIIQWPRSQTIETMPVDLQIEADRELGGQLQKPSLRLSA